MKWTRSQYYSETHQRQMQSLTGYFKTKDNKTIVMHKEYKKELKQYNDPKITDENKKKLLKFFDEIISKNYSIYSYEIYN